MELVAAKTFCDALDSALVSTLYSASIAEKDVLLINCPSVVNPLSSVCVPLLAFANARKFSCMTLALVVEIPATVWLPDPPDPATPTVAGNVAFVSHGSSRSAPLTPKANISP